MTGSVLARFTRPGGLGLASAARRRPPLLVLIASLVVLTTLLLAIFGEFITPMDPALPDLSIGVSPPIPGHPLGTDALGRDVLSRLMVGARTALIGPVVVAAGAMLLGSVVGVLGGYMGGRVDAVVMRWTEFMYALPALLVVLVVVGIIGGGYLSAILLYIVLIAPFDARIVRGATLEQKPRAYVEGARGLGLSRRQIMLGHIWPNVAPIEFSNAFLTVAWAITAFAALSYLGLGVDPGTPDWGRMLSDGRLLLNDNPLVALAPGIALVLLAASLDVLGNALFDWFTKRRGR